MSPAKLWLAWTVPAAITTHPSLCEIRTFPPASTTHRFDWLTVASPAANRTTFWDWAIRPLFATTNPPFFWVIFAASSNVGSPRSSSGSSTAGTPASFASRATSCTMGFAILAGASSVL